MERKVKSVHYCCLVTVQHMPFRSSFTSDKTSVLNTYSKLTGKLRVIIFNALAKNKCVITEFVCTLQLQPRHKIPHGEDNATFADDASICDEIRYWCWHMPLNSWLYLPRGFPPYSDSLISQRGWDEMVDILQLTISDFLQWKCLKCLTFD